MEFLKKMKSREIVEMSLKTLMAVLVGLVLIVLMEGMIYGIYMDKINDNTTSQYAAGDCIAYCEEVGDDEFKVYLNYTIDDSWSVKLINSSKEGIENSGYKKVVWDAPNPFEVSISGVHYIVMGAFIVAILGFYGWRFYKLNKEYTKFEKRFQKTGKIFA